MFKMLRNLQRAHQNPFRERPIRPRSQISLCKLCNRMADSSYGPGRCGPKKCPAPPNRRKHHKQFLTSSKVKEKSTKINGRLPLLLNYRS